MSVEFKTVVTKLWASLGLPEPVFRQESSIILNVDGTNVELSESQDGRHVVATGTAGQLSADPSRRAHQVRRLLQMNLATMATRRACVGVEPKGADTPDVVVRGVAAYDGTRINRLTEVIEDVLFLTEAHQADLKEHSETMAARRRAPGSQPAEDTVIFRP
jgi:hypothetical protein